MASRRTNRRTDEKKKYRRIKKFLTQLTLTFPQEFFSPLAFSVVFLPSLKNPLEQKLPPPYCRPCRRRRRRRRRKFDNEKTGKDGRQLLAMCILPYSFLCPLPLPAHSQFLMFMMMMVWVRVVKNNSEFITN